MAHCVLMDRAVLVVAQGKLVASLLVIAHHRGSIARMEHARRAARLANRAAAMNASLDVVAMATSATWPLVTSVLARIIAVTTTNVSHVVCLEWVLVRALCRAKVAVVWTTLQTSASPPVRSDLRQGLSVRMGVLSLVVQPASLVVRTIHAAETAVARTMCAWLPVQVVAVDSPGRVLELWRVVAVLAAEWDSRVVMGRIVLAEAWRATKISAKPVVRQGNRVVRAACAMALGVVRVPRVLRRVSRAGRSLVHVTAAPVTSRTNNVVVSG